MVCRSHSADGRAPCCRSAGLVPNGVRYHTPLGLAIAANGDMWVGLAVQHPRAIQSWIPRPVFLLGPQVQSPNRPLYSLSPNPRTARWPAIGLAWESIGRHSFLQSLNRMSCVTACSPRFHRRVQRRRRPHGKRAYRADSGSRSAWRVWPKERKVSSQPSRFKIKSRAGKQQRAPAGHKHGGPSSAGSKAATRVVAAS